MDVVVYEQVAVLEILAFADTVGGDEKVDLFVLVGEGGGLFGAAFGDGGEVGEDVVEIDGRVCWVISLEDLILAKEAVGRGKDKLTAVELRLIAAKRKR